MSTFDRAKAVEDISRIHLAYPEYVDRGDIEGVVGLFAGIRMGDEATPEDELRPYCRGCPKDVFGVTDNV